MIVAITTSSLRVLVSTPGDWDVIVVIGRLVHMLASKIILFLTSVLASLVRPPRHEDLALLWHSLPGVADVVAVVVIRRDDGRPLLTHGQFSLVSLVCHWYHYWLPTAEMWETASDQWALTCPITEWEGEGDSHPDSSCSDPIIVSAPNYVLSSSHQAIHLPADNIILITGWAEHSSSINIISKVNSILNFAN